MNTRNVPEEYKTLSNAVYVGSDGWLYWNLSVMKSNNRPHKEERLGSRCTVGYPKIYWNNKHIQLHTFMFWLHNGYLPTIVDHINNDTLNYKIDNLRESDRCSNNLNTPKYNLCVDTLPLKKGGYSYRVRLSFKGKLRVLGTYKDEAIATYAAWQVREWFNPSFCPMPEILKRILDTGTREHANT